MPATLGQAELLAQVAHLYFEAEQDQGAIARRLHSSRSSVSRLLNQARQQGIVEIRINYPLPLAPEVAAELQSTFGLKEARILKTTQINTHESLHYVSLLAAKFLEENLREGDIVATSWGKTLLQVVENFHPIRRLPVEVVQLVGTLGAAPSAIDAANLVRRLAEALDGTYFNLNAPLLVESAGTQRALMQEPTIRQVLDRARQASMALVGVGALERGSSSAIRAKLLNAAQLGAIRKQGAVGDICSQFFDVFGKPVAEQLNQRVVGLDLASLRQIPRIVGIASGPHKAKAILGALRGQLINVLITDELTARRVLRLNGQLNLTKHISYSKGKA